MSVQKLLNRGLCGLFFGGIFTAMCAIPAHADECGVNLFNPQLLLQADFTSDSNNQYKGKWNDHLNRYIERYPYGFVDGRDYKITYKLDCSDSNAGNQYITFLKEGNETIKMHSNACTDGRDGNVEIVSSNGEKITGLKVETLENSAPFEEGITISNLMVVRSDVDTSAGRFIPYNACKRIATQKMLEDSAVGMRDRLSYVANVITNLITQSKTNTRDIGTLNANKQTRPAEGCPAGYDSCLLVKDANGNNVWYPIETCSSTGIPTFNFVRRTVWAGPEVPDIEPWGIRISGDTDLMCRSSLIGCQDDEWVTAYDIAVDSTIGDPVGNKIVFGTGRRVAIAESTRGTVVTLPNNVQSGDVCVCKATRYRIWNSDTSSYGASQAIDTDKWFVAGMTTSDGVCFYACGDDRGGDKQTYYMAISNSCMDNAVTAQMCRYHEFFNDVVNNYFNRGDDGSGMAPAYEYGTVRDDGSTWAGCMPVDNMDVTDTGHCVENGTWVTKYYKNYARTAYIGYVYGFGGYINVPAGTSVGDIVDVNVADVSTTPTGYNAAVCVVKGYRKDGASSDTNLTTSKAYVAHLGEGYSGVRGDACTEYSASRFGQLYADIAAMCMAN